MAEPEVVALATRDRNPPATPAGIRPNIGWVAQSVERRCEEPEVAGSVPAPSTKHARVPSRIPSTTDPGTQVIFAPVAKPDKASGFEPEDLGVRVSPGAPLRRGKGAGSQHGLISHRQRPFDSASRFQPSCPRSSIGRALVCQARGSRIETGRGRHIVQKRVNRAGPETALNTDRSRERLGFEYPALCHFPESEPDRVRARLESDATVQIRGSRPPLSAKHRG